MPEGKTSRFTVPKVSQLAEAKIDFSGVGDNVLIAGVALQTIRVFRLFFVVGADMSLTFKDAATALTGAIPMLANGSFILDFQGDPWFTTAAGDDFILNASVGGQVSGRIYYTQST